MQYTPTSFQIQRLPDKEIYLRLLAIPQHLGFNLADISYHYLFSQDAVQVKSDKVPAEMQAILDLNTILLKSLHVYFNKDCYIGIDRQMPPAPHAIPNTDTFIVQVPTARIAPELVAQLVTLCRERFTAVDSIPLESFLTDDQRRHFEAREIAVGRLEKSLEEFNVSLQANVTANNAATRAEQERLRATYEAKQHEADEQHRARLSEVIEQQRQFAEEKKLFDSREHKHVRRDLTAKLQELLKQRNTTFELTRGTKRQRWPIVTVYIVLMLFFLTATVWSYAIPFQVPHISSTRNDVTISGHVEDDRSQLYDAYGKYVQAIFDGLRKVAFPLGFILTSSYFLRWLNRGFQIHAQEEFKLKRLELDIVRASWVVETALDWFAETKELLPRYLADPINRGLFAAEAQAEDTGMTAADSLASALLGSASRAEIRLPNGEVVFDNRGISRLKKKPKPPEDDES